MPCGCGHSPRPLLPFRILGYLLPPACKSFFFFFFQTSLWSLLGIHQPLNFFDPCLCYPYVASPKVGCVLNYLSLKTCLFYPSRNLRLFRFPMQLSQTIATILKLRDSSRSSHWQQMALLLAMERPQEHLSLVFYSTKLSL